ncbi:hypothetical protein imdm_1254 [gamma proteobacterium IMCC2047]|nr:hypothetical protein imdm_1254 [gamma proteobacterium IMCC2047]
MYVFFYRCKNQNISVANSIKVRLGKPSLVAKGYKKAKQLCCMIAGTAV